MLTPLNNHVLVSPVAASERVSAAGIVLPATAKSAVRRGIVANVDGNVHGLHSSDEVLYLEHDITTEVEHNDARYVLIDVDKILAKVR